MAQRRPDSTQLARQWAILTLLSKSPREFSVGELAEQLGSTKTTIQRDLATLADEFAVVRKAVNKQKQVYSIDPSIKALESIRFGNMELLALHAAEAHLAALASSPIYEDLRRVTMKLRGFLAEKKNSGIHDLARVFQPHARGYVDYGAHHETIDELVDGIAKRHFQTIRYHSSWNQTTKTHRIRPLKLLWHRSALYLLAIIDGKSEITTFAVQRIEELSTEDESFQKPRANVEEHCKKAFGVWVSDEVEEVEILFSEAMAWRVEERTFHPDEEKERLEDGRLRYCIRSSAQWEIVPWVLSYGANAELVRPKSWRDAVRETVEEMAGVYGESVRRQG